MADRLIPFDPLRGMKERERQLEARRNEIKGWQVGEDHAIEIWVDGENIIHQIEAAEIHLDCGLTLRFQRSTKGGNHGTE